MTWNLLLMDLYNVAKASFYLITDCTKKVTEY